MHSTLSFLAILGVAAALPGNWSPAANTTSSSSTLSKSSSAWGQSASSSTPSFMPSGHVTSSSPSIKSTWSSVPSGHVSSPVKSTWSSAPSGHSVSSSKSSPSQPSGGSWSRRPQTPTGTTRTVTGSAVITSTITETITQTLPTLVPCSTETSSNGIGWWTTYLSTSYYTTTYKTTETVVISSAPTGAVTQTIPTGWQPVSSPIGGSCPAAPTVTSTITQFVGQPSSVSVGPGEHVTSECVTITVSTGYTTTIWVSYPAVSTTSTHIVTSTSKPSGSSKPASASVKPSHQSSLPLYPSGSGSAHASGSIKPTGHPQTPSGSGIPKPSGYGNGR